MSHRAYWIATCIFLALVASKFDPRSGFTSLIRFGETWENRRLPSLQGLPIATVSHSNGYDGQFYAQIAVDPLLSNPDTSRALDVPGYRARRILVPAVAAAAGLGTPWWTLQAYALINVACWIALAWLLAKILPPSNPVNCSRWLGCMFSMGVLESVRQSLVDLPGLLLLVLAIFAQARSRPTQSTVWLALGNLAKESNLLGSFAVCFGSPERPFATKKSILTLGLAALPLLAWSCYVGYRLPSPAESSGLGNFTWPLLGLGRHVKSCLLEMASGNWDGRYSMGLIGAVSFLTQALSLWLRPNFHSAWWRAGAVYALLLLFLSPWVWSGYWAVSRVILPMTVAFNLLLPASTRLFWPLWALGNATILHGLWRFL
jgi:hypothetical protein